MRLYIIEAPDDADVINTLNPILNGEGRIKEIHGCKDCKHCTTDIYEDGYCMTKHLRVDMNYINVNGCSWFKSKEE